MSVDLSFLNNSIDHHRIAKDYAKADVESFPANTVELQQAVRYWNLPVEYTQEKSLIERQLKKKYHREIEIVRRYLWQSELNRFFTKDQKEKPSTFTQTFTYVKNAIYKILPKTEAGRRTLKFIILTILGLVSAVLSFTVSPHPIHSVVFAVSSLSFLFHGPYLIISAQRMLI